MEVIPKNWLITGGCGFIGVNLIDHLLREYPGTNIRVLDNLSVGSRDDLKNIATFREVSNETIGSPPSGVELLIGDILDYSSCERVGAGVEAVVHLAANTGVAPSVENPRMDMEVNVNGTFNVLEACRINGVQKFIFASSGAPLGEVDPPIHEEKAPKPVSPYGASKLAGEGYCSAYFRTFGIKTVALRFGNVYGPRSKHKMSVVANFFKRALMGENLEIFGDGNQTRDFIYIQDLIQAIMLAITANAGGEIFQIATHKETTVNEIADMIKDIIESDTDLKVNIIYKNPRLGDVKRNFSDISKARELLKFAPQFEIRKGLIKTYEFYTKKS